MSALNRWKLLLDYLTRKTVLRGQPVEFIVETTARCNLYCPMCPRETFKQPNADMSEEVYRRFLEQVARTAEHAMLIGLGEPLLDRAIFDRITRCRNHHISALISTNGTLLDEAGAEKLLATGIDHVTLSIDGTTKETVEFYRKGARFEKLQENFIRFARMKHERRARTHVVVQMVLLEKNRHQAKEFIRFWKAVPGVDEVRLKADETNLLQPERRDASDWKWPCHYLWRGPMYIRHDGDVHPCCQSYTLGGQPVGNLREQTLAEICNNTAIQQMRRLHVARRAGEIDICRRCCTAIPHPVLVVASLLVHADTVRKLIPLVERLSYLGRWPLRLLKPAQLPRGLS